MAGEQEGDPEVSQRVWARRDAFAAGRDIIIYPPNNARGETPAHQGVLWDDRDSPYMGLDAFGKDDAPLFFGREKDIKAVQDRLSTLGASLLIVSGVSGAGKSSLLRAGVLPRFEGPQIVITPTPAPLDELAHAAASLTGTLAPGIRRELDQDPSGFALIMRQAATAWARDRQGGHSRKEEPILMVVDQFEKLFTQCEDEDEQRGFMAALYSAATIPLGPLELPTTRVILAIRADFEARCAYFDELADAVDNRYLLKPMGDQQLRLAISGPATVAGSIVDPALIDLLVSQARSRASMMVSAGQRAGLAVGPETLPLLSYALDQAWRTKTGDAVTLADYERTGGIEGAIAASAERAYAQLSVGQQDAARQVFMHLTTTSSDGTVTAIRTSRDDLATSFAAADVDATLDAFASPQVRLLTLGDDSVEISHEALLTAWTRLANWLDGDLDDRIRYSRLHADALTWDSNGRAASYLYSPGRLEELEEAIRRWDAAPQRYPRQEINTAFIRTGRRAAQRATRRRRGVIAILSALTLAAAVAAGAAWRYDVNANQQREIASTQHRIALSQQLATESLSLDATAPITARQLAVAAWSIYPTSQAADTMLKLVTEQEQNGELPAAPVFDPMPAGSPPLGFASSVLTGEVIPPSVLATAVSPAGNRMATVDSQGYIRMWDLTTGAPIGPPWPTNDAGPSAMNSNWMLTFSPDGRHLASADSTGPVQLWDVSTGEPMGKPLRVANKVNAVAFSPRGTEIAIATGSQVALFDVASGVQVRLSRPTQGGNIEGVAYNASGELLASVSYSDTIRVWDISTGSPAGKELPFRQGINSNSAALSPGGRYLAIYGDQIPQLIIPAADRRIRLSMPFEAYVEQLAFSPDGKLAAGSLDTLSGYIEVWSTATGRPAGPPIYVGSGISVFSLALSPNDRELVSADSDGYIRQWNISTGKPAAESTSVDTAMDVGAVSLSPDGHLLAAVDSEDGYVRLWDTATGKPLGRPMGSVHGSGYAVEFSPDGRLLAYVDSDGYARLWNVATGASADGQLLETDMHQGKGVVTLAFSASGKTLASADADGYVRLWNMATGKVDGKPFRGLPAGANIYSLAFSPDATLVAGAGTDGHLYIWDAASGKLTGSLKGSVRPCINGNAQINPLSAAAVQFSPTGALVASADCADGYVRLWSTTTGKPIGTPIDADPQVSPGRVPGVAFSPDGKLLIAAAGDGYVRFWSVSSGVQVGISRPMAGPSVYNPFGGDVANVALSRNGSLLASAFNGVIQTWQVWPFTDPYATLCAEVGPPPPYAWPIYLDNQSYSEACANVAQTPHEE